MYDQLFKPNMILAIDSETTGLVRAVTEFDREKRKYCYLMN